MINDLVRRSDYPVGEVLNGEVNHLEDKNPTAIARVISSAENFPEVAKPALEKIAKINQLLFLFLADTLDCILDFD